MTWESVVDKYETWEEASGGGVFLPPMAGGGVVGAIMVVSMAWQEYNRRQDKKEMSRAENEAKERYLEDRTRQREIDAMMRDAQKQEMNMSEAQWNNYLADRADAKAREGENTEYRKRLLSNIDAPPEDRIRAYDEYAKTLESKMGGIAGEKYNQTVRASEEALAAKGMLGSRAYVDQLAELEKSKLEMDTDIAERSVLAREDLGERDRRYWLDLIGALDAGSSRQTVAAMEGAKLAQNPLSGAISATGAMYGGGGISDKMAQWDAMAANSRAQGRAQAGNTLSGLAFLYGMNRGGGSGGGTPGKANTLRFNSPEGYTSTWSY